MRNEEEKAKVELRVFSDFAHAANLKINPVSVRKGSVEAREPDIYCEVNRCPVYFELTEACAPELAAAITNFPKKESQKKIGLMMFQSKRFRES